MALQLANITFDCDDPLAVSAFWAAAIGFDLDDGGSEFFVSASMSTPSMSPNWFFAKVPEGKTVKNRLHFDLEADDPVTEVARLVDLGATKVAEKDEWGHQWTVLTDIEGNEFCVSGPHA